MKLNQSFVLLLILGLGLLVRIYGLGSVPYGFHIDEVKAGLNAYSILTTGKDDKGNFIPMYYDSFGDFRPTGVMYLIIPSIMVFGRSVFATRLPVAIIGALTVLPLFFLVDEVFGKKQRRLALLSALMLALNPWHIITSRATSESIVAVFLVLLGLLFLIKLRRNARLFYLILAVLCLTGSYFFYHSVRVLVPVWVVTVLVFDWLIMKRDLCWKQIAVLVLVTLATCLIFLAPESRGRLSQVGLKSDFQVLYEVTKMPTEEGPGHVLEARVFHNRLAAYARRFVEEYRSYFGVDFLIGNAAKPIRYNVPQVGLLTYVEYILIVVGLFFVSKRKELLLILGLMIVAPLSAAFTIEDTPNMQRAITVLPFLVIISAYGLYELNNLEKRWKWLTILIIVVYLANFIYFWHMYMVHQKMGIAAYYRDGGAVELVKKNDEVGINYKQVYLTNAPDNLKPWFVFLNKSDLGNLVFTENKCPSIEYLKSNVIPVSNLLFVDNEACVPQIRLIGNFELIDVAAINRPDNSPPFWLRTLKPIRQL